MFAAVGNYFATEFNKDDKLGGMNGSLTYGPMGRLISGVVGFAGILAAAVSASQQANLIGIFPAGYNKYFTAAAIVSLFVTLFSERITGGASKPEVRIAAQQADNKNGLERTNLGD